MHNYVFDVLVNSYSPLVEEIYDQMTGRNAILELNDRFHLFKLQSFMLEFARLQAYTEHDKAKKE
jgi:hypothetical protein